MHQILRRHRGTVRAALLVLLVLLAGCGGAPTAPSAPTGAAARRDTFVFARNDVSRTLDPVLTADNVDIWAFMNIYDQLVRLSDDGTQLVPGLAETWDISADGTTYTFHLRSGLRFSDGSALTASDAVWSLERARHPDLGSSSWSLDPVAQVAAPDPATVVVRFKSPSPAFLAPLAMFNASITSKAYYDKVGAEVFGQQPLGSGPYRLKEWVKGQYMLLERNPLYWEAGLPVTDQIKLTTVPDDNTRVLQLQGGQVDGIEYLPFNRIDELHNGAATIVQLLPSTYVGYILFNTRQAPFDDVAVRQALSYATDRAALLKTVLFDHGTIATSFMSPATPFHAKDLPQPAYDLAKAKALLATTKYAKGFTTRLTVTAGDQTDAQLATALKSMWAQLGVDVEIEQVDVGVRSDKFNSHDFAVLTNYWTDDMVDADEIATYLAAYPSVQAMQSGFNDPATNAAVAQARLEPDPTKRATLYRQVQQTINEQAPVLSLYYKPFAVGLARSVHDFRQLPTGRYVFDRVWVER